MSERDRVRRALARGFVWLVSVRPAGASGWEGACAFERQADAKYLRDAINAYRTWFTWASTGGSGVVDVYVVMGVSGEYSDRTEWPVRAFLEEVPARALVVALQERARVAQSLSGRAAQAYMESVDSGYRRSDYTETEYYVMTVPLAESQTTGQLVIEEQDRRFRRGIALQEEPS